MNAPIYITDTHNIEAEQALLGAIMVNNEVLRYVDGIIEPEHFFEAIHQRIYEIVSSLVRVGRVANPVTMSGFLPREMTIGELTIGEYLAALCANSTTIVNAPDYAQVIRDYADRRAISAIAADSVPRSSEHPVEKANQAIDRLSELISQRPGQRDGSVDMKGAVIKAMDSAAKAFASDSAVLGLSYGLHDLDIRTSGAQEGDLIIIAGRPSMGKTALAVSVARNLGIRNDPGAFFSLEMSVEQLTHRMLSDDLYESQYKTAYNLMRTGNFKESAFTGMRDAALRIGEWPIHIDPQAGLTVAQVAARARHRKRTKGLKWIIIDYLQLLQASDRYAGKRVDEISEITRGLKNLAKELSVPIIALSQLSRDVERREDKRPNLSDLRESGSIEQDADVVMFVYRESYYLQHREPKPGTVEHQEWQTALDNAWNRVDVIIGKNRMGPTGTVSLFCDIGHNAFRNQHDDGRSYTHTNESKVLL